MPKMCVQSRWWRRNDTSHGWISRVRIKFEIWILFFLYLLYLSYLSYILNNSCPNPEGKATVAKETDNLDSFYTTIREESGESTFTCNLMNCKSSFKEFHRIQQHVIKHLIEKADQMLSIKDKQRDPAICSVCFYEASSYLSLIK